MGEPEPLPPLEVIGERIKTIEESLDEAVKNGEMTPEEVKLYLNAYINAFLDLDVESQPPTNLSANEC